MERKAENDFGRFKDEQKFLFPSFFHSLFLCLTSDVGFVKSRCEKIYKKKYKKFSITNSRSKFISNFDTND